MRVCIESKDLETEVFHYPECQGTCTNTRSATKITVYLHAHAIYG